MSQSWVSVQPVQYYLRKTVTKKWKRHGTENVEHAHEEGAPGTAFIRRTTRQRRRGGGGGGGIGALP